MEAKQQVNCPKCGKLNNLDSWHHSVTGQLIEATICENCNADYARIDGGNWKLVKQFEDDD